MPMGQNETGGKHVSAVGASEVLKRVVPENEISTTRTTDTSLQNDTQRSSSPRRPKTRSQSGITVPNRRRRDDSPVAKARRTAKTTRTKPQSQTASEPVDASPEEVAQPPASSVERRVSSAPDEIDNKTLERLTPLEDNRRLPRSRAVLPVPVPNLTKKSRGRRVPTRDTGSNGQQEQETRSYVCTAEGCGKCFHRGEHLKRHIRSIHTHEKPFKCTYPMCEKHFNRHDNLLQHLKVHKDPPSGDSEAHLNTFSSSDHTESPPVSPLPNIRPLNRSLMNQTKISSEIYDRTVRYSPYPAPITYHSISEPVSFAASMAVSSLRTEIQ
ncbi:hypothetical protein BDQ17DRAFT_1345860 [Cyathus striatus]|nr:hypothetical protein BDQ17DRAFT_1345860 [Cyathus striatus]